MKAVIVYTALVSTVAFCSQFYPLEVVAAGEMVEAGVGDERAVVQLQHHQVLTGAGRQSQVPVVVLCSLGGPCFLLTCFHKHCQW